MRPPGRAPSPEPPAPAISGADVVELGRIVGRHGVRGDVRVLLHNPDSTALSGASEIWLMREGSVERRRLLSLRPHKRVLLAQLEGVDTANAADALVGSTVELSDRRYAVVGIAPAISK